MVQQLCRPFLFRPPCCAHRAVPGNPSWAVVAGGLFRFPPSRHMRCRVLLSSTILVQGCLWQWLKYRARLFCAGVGVLKAFIGMRR